MNTETQSNETPTEALNKHGVLRCTDKFDFHNGVQVTRNDLERWHKDILASFAKDNLDTHYIRSGNGMVIGRRNKETGTIEIFEVSRGYEFFTYEPS